MLQRIFPALALLLLIFSGCQNLKKQSANETPPPEAQTKPNWNASYVIEGNNPDSAMTYQIRQAPKWVNVPIDALPPASASRKAYLSTGWWHLNMAFQPSDTLVHQNYQHKWLRFREDQTFDILIKGKVVETGRWNWDEPNQEIYISCKDTYINNTWKVIDKGFVMIWKGNTSLNVTGIQIRLASNGTPPSSE